MKTTLNRRLSLLTVALVGVGVLLLARLASFQFQIDAASYLENKAALSYQSAKSQIPERGKILDRNGELLATNMMEYKINASPNYVSDKPKAAQDLAQVLGDDPARLLDLLNSKDEQTNQPKPNVFLAGPVPFDVAQKVVQLNIFGVTLEQSPRRIYPQNSLAAQVLGFVGWADDGQRGYVGVEGEYENDLAGQVRIVSQSAIPFEADSNTVPPPGRDIVLTIDRNVQYLAESELQDAITKYGATSGSILIMDPRNGEILAMASYPGFDPNNYAQYVQIDPRRLNNPAISDTYEPGSVFKIVTASVALQSGKLDLNWTYYEGQPFLEVTGFKIYDWDHRAHGQQGFVDVLVNSWNIGTSMMAKTMGPTVFYKGLKDFGVGVPTNIDLDNESGGFLKTPGDTYWSDSDLYTNSFGQGLTVTPLQMLTFANTIAYNGQMMQPHIRLKTIDGGRIIAALPAAIRTPISPAVAAQIRDIMVQVVQVGEGKAAKVPGYTIAGKTGTAQIACNTCEGGYDPELQEASFVGFLPADEPRVSILVKLDNVSKYASETSAPAFAQLVSRLVVLMNIPTDAQRLALRQSGGDTSQILGK